jgi:hypothetical protein
MRQRNPMKFFKVCPLPGPFRAVRFRLAMLFVVVAHTAAFSEDKPKSKVSPTPQPTAVPKSSPAAKPAPTPDTKIDAKMEAELLQAEDRFVNAVRNRDAKELEEILHPDYRTAMDGSESATPKRRFILRATDGRMPAYKIERERKLERSGDSFTVEGLAMDVAHPPTEDHPTEEWAFVSRIWSREGGQWIATAQTVKPLEEHERQEKREQEEKREAETKSK